LAREILGARGNQGGVGAKKTTDLAEDAWDDGRMQRQENDVAGSRGVVDPGEPLDPGEKPPEFLQRIRAWVANPDDLR